MTTGNVPAKGSRRPNLNGFADLNGMTSFRSEETRRHDGMAEVEGSKWSAPRTMRIPSAPPSNLTFALKALYVVSIRRIGTNANSDIRGSEVINVDRVSLATAIT